MSKWFRCGAALVDAVIAGGAALTASGRVDDAILFGGSTLALELSKAVSEGEAGDVQEEINQGIATQLKMLEDQGKLQAHAAAQLQDELRSGVNKVELAVRKAQGDVVALMFAHRELIARVANLEAQRRSNPQAPTLIDWAFEDLSPEAYKRLNDPLINMDQGDLEAIAGQTGIKNPKTVLGADSRKTAANLINEARLTHHVAHLVRAIQTRIRP